MNKKLPSDWDPRSERALQDPLETYDAMRASCPVAHCEYLGWSLFRHQDVLQVLNDHKTFSNAVSAHTSVPNGMDPPVHTGYRNIIEPYFSEARMREFEPHCRRIAEALVENLPGRGEVELMDEFAHPFALDIQCAFTGWSTDLQEPLRRWVVKNHTATLARDRKTMTEVAAEFQEFVEALVSRREKGWSEPDDVVSRLMTEEIDGRPLSIEEITSILRNWTVGELATIAASVGIIVHHLCLDNALQTRLRDQLSEIPLCIEEILRCHGPLLSNRRILTRDIVLGDRSLSAGDRVTIMWASANRDEEAFEAAQEVRLHRDQTNNLLWGAGIHVCPGAPLARLELKIVLECLLQKTNQLSLSEKKEPVGALYPAAGFSKLRVRVQ